jgi:hypothetical protein
MKIIDILFLIYLLLVLVSAFITAFIRQSTGLSIYIFSTFLIFIINNLFFYIFNVNYLNSNDYILKRIINIFIALGIILIIVIAIIYPADENFSNTKISLMQKIITRLNNLINNNFLVIKY